MGVRVILLRANSTGRYPAECYFEKATGWLFTANLLSIIQDATSEPSVIAEFSAGGVESVEFGSKEIA